MFGINQVKKYMQLLQLWWNQRLKFKTLKLTQLQYQLKYLKGQQVQK